MSFHSTKLIFLKPRLHQGNQVHMYSVCVNHRIF